MSIMDLFRTAPTTPAAAPAPSSNAPNGAPGSTPSPTKQSPTTAANGIVPNNPGEGKGNDPNTSESPFAQFEKLWEASTPEEDAAAAASNSPVSQIDPAKLNEQVKNLDFSKVIPPDMLKKVIAGGEEAGQAFASSLNSVAQTVFAQSAMATNKLIESALTKQAKQFQEQLPELVKRHTFGETLRSENPAFSNPAVLPLIDAVSAQMSVKFPQATAQELSKLSKQYLNQIGLTFAPPPASPGTNANGTPKKVDTDWSKFLT